MEDFLIRSEALLGTNAIECLAQSTVAIFGLGGVGSFVCEELARAGVGTLLVFDGDIIEASNINRQLFALHSTIGMPKSEVAKHRILDINPQCQVKAINRFILPNQNDRLDTDIFIDPINLMVDALDTVSTKIALAVESNTRAIPMIATMGCANRLDSGELQLSDIYNTKNCPLCRVMRRELKKRQIPSLPVIYSTEQPQKAQDAIKLASIPWVPNVAGLKIGEFVIKKLLDANG